MDVKDLRKAIKQVEKGFDRVVVRPSRYKELYVLTKKFPFVKKTKIGRDYQISIIRTEPMAAGHLVGDSKMYDDLKKKLGDVKCRTK